jgi:hypothetical protein
MYQKDANGVTVLNPLPFSTELELETALVEAPNLVAEPDGHELGSAQEAAIAMKQLIDLTYAEITSTLQSA